ncbi:MAG TPA: MBL fold metallo-hydrolase [Candidatus Limnocylindria bacterium]
MRVEVWGTRGSLSAPGTDTLRYGGNTSCLLVRGSEGEYIVLDAGTGIRPLGVAIPADVRRIDILVTHLHMDHLQGLGFFAPLFDPEVEIHIWGPPSTTMPLHSRLSRYLSPPLFPVRLRDVPRFPELHDARSYFRIGGMRVRADRVCHPGETVGYRLTDPNGSCLAYLPDHEPALGHRHFPGSGDWTSGFALVRHADLLIHDAQYTDAEYPEHVGWGHSSVGQVAAFSAMTEVRQLMPFHHDPGHDDAQLDGMMAEIGERAPSVQVLPGREGDKVEVANG